MKKYIESVTFECREPYNIPIWHVQTYMGENQKDFSNETSARIYAKHLAKQLGVDLDYIEVTKTYMCDDESLDIESSTSIKCSTRDSYKVDWLKKALQNMQEDEYFIPRLSVNDNGRYIDLDEGAIQLLIDYYN